MSAAYRVRISGEAEADLERIQAYLVDQGAADAAEALIAAFLDRIEALGHFPFRGRIPKEFEVLQVTDFRQIVIPPYRLFYEVVGREVRIVLITDGRRDIRSLLRRLHDPAAEIE